MRIYILMCTFLACFFSSAQEGKYQSLLLDKTLTDNANAVVRLDEMKINVLATNKMVYSVNQVVTVLNKKGDNRYSSTKVSFDKETKIKNLEVYVYDKLGEEIERIKKKDFQDLSAADGFSLYTDNRILYNNLT